MDVRELVGDWPVTKHGVEISVAYTRVCDGSHGVSLESWYRIAETPPSEDAKHGKIEETHT